ncbi:hypothetical protein Hanom_Chr06g00499671 [Helianthus anomalus]
MFSNLSRSCVRGRTSEHGMCRRIMLKSPCSKHLTRHTCPTDHSRASTDYSRASRTTPILSDSSEEVRRRTGVVCRTWTHQHNMRTLPKLSGPSKDAGG